MTDLPPADPPAPDDAGGGLDSLLSLESAFRAEGARAGYSKGATQGRLEGRSAGFDAGASRGLERQFYLGGASAVLSLESAHPGHFSARTVAAARKTKAMADGLRLHERGNDATVDIEGEIEKLRHEFRLLCALARLPPIRPRVLQPDPELSF